MSCHQQPASCQPDLGHEEVHIARTASYCGLCDEYAAAEAHKPIAVICCEGGCLRGEVARQAANQLCYQQLPEQTVRICLGGAFTKDSGQRELVRRASRVLALEGCAVDCATRMMQGVVAVPVTIIHVDELYEFDRRLFGINQMSQAEMTAHGAAVAKEIALRLEAEHV